MFTCILLTVALSQVAQNPIPVSPTTLTPPERRAFAANRATIASH